ncbi:MAG: aminopeptidase P family protein [Lachnospiraceae bacterium]|nr:aminopeptidase P family protein [Lachnospiraceae bacterium]
MSSAAERIEALREKMKQEGIDAYYINTADFHNSEYVSDYFKVREFFSGFTGSAGDLVVFANEAGLWTDGRYFGQAERELAGSGIKLFKLGEKDVPRPEAYIKDKLNASEVLGFDGRCITASYGKVLKKAAKEKKAKICFKKDLSQGIFERPELKASKAEVLRESLSGESVGHKLERVRRKLAKAGADSLFLSKTDDIMWLFNIRGDDIPCNPVLLSYACITSDKSWLFVNNASMSRELKVMCGRNNIVLLSYDSAADFLKKDRALRGRVLIDEEQVSYSVYKLIKKKSEKVISAENPTTAMKAVKNECEIGHMRDIYLKDSLALTRFIREVSSSVGDKEWTEYSASEKLEKYRRKIPEFRSLSFDTIAAYGANAAMMHYKPSKENEVRLEKKGMLLVDSGGQYNGGTTDVTRTIVLGDITKEEKRAYTFTAIGMLKLLNTVFLKGCTGVNVDIQARGRLWREGIDYKCGTGHGVGYILNVHEGPHGIRWRSTKRDARLKEGMDVTNEPGVYREGKFGVRIENVMLVAADKKTEDGEFLRFENLTFVPIDDKGIDRSLMNSEELEQYLAFQQSVYKKLSPLMNNEEKKWLKKYAGIVGRTAGARKQH